VSSTAAGVSADTPYDFFLERYADAYRAELAHFMDVCGGRAEPLVGIEDGRQALALAEAAIESARSGRAVRV
jgi:myo-inositol 2-dehydrogenase/D-chiro-inositol 1-dehydrogenase